jgi:Zn-dependent peptidase ImmA (M78 family)
MIDEYIKKAVTKELKVFLEAAHVMRQEIKELESRINKLNYAVKARQPKSTKEESEAFKASLVRVDAE